MNYYIHIDVEKVNHAGSKAVDDVETILDKRGYKRLRMFSSNSSIRFFRMVVKVIQLIKAFFVPKESVLFLQHPYYMKRDYMSAIIRLKEKRHLKLVILIHDLESIRKVAASPELYEKRDNLLVQYADVIIAHNEIMKKYLVEEKKYCPERIVVLGIFDYIMPDDYKINNSYDKESNNIDICIAGNLQRKTCAYIYECANIVPDNVNLKLYGVNFETESANEKCKYIGEYTPEELPTVMKGMYGLVWYGNDSDKLRGGISHYLPYINPHKVSSYVVAGLPVILPSCAGIASFIVNNKLGVTIESLANIDTVLKKIPYEDYAVYKKNVCDMAKKLRKGFYTNQAIDKAEELLNNIR